MTKVYWPELGDSMPECQITSRICYYPRGHYHLETYLDLHGQGIYYDGKETIKEMLYEPELKQKNH